MLLSQGIDSKEPFPLANVAWRAGARICRPFKEPRNRFPALRAGTTTYLLYRPTKLNRLAESIFWNQFPGSLNVYKYVLGTITLFLLGS